MNYAKAQWDNANTVTETKINSMWYNKNSNDINCIFLQWGRHKIILIVFHLLVLIVWKTWDNEVKKINLNWNDGSLLNIVTVSTECIHLNN